LVVSQDLLSELAEVLARPKFRHWITHQAGAEFVDGLAVDAHVVDDPPSVPGLSPNPDDDSLTALARAANADYLVSGDRHLTSLAVLTRRCSPLAPSSIESTLPDAERTERPARPSATRSRRCIGEYEPLELAELLDAFDLTVTYDEANRRLELAVTVTLKP